MGPDELLPGIRAAEVDAPSWFAPSSLEVEGGATFDRLPPDVVVSPRVALNALAAADAWVQVYEYAAATVFQGCRLVKESRPPFVLFVYGRVAENPTSRLIGGALRIYSDEAKLARLAQDPSFAFAVILDRYGLDFLASEGGERARFLPVVLVPREKFDLTPPIPADRFVPEVLAAFDLAGLAPTDLIANIQVKIPTDGPVQVFWPFVLDEKRYVADVRRNKGSR